MVVDVNVTDAHDFQSTLVLFYTTRPEVPYPRCILAWFGDIGRIDGDGFSFACVMLADDRAVERKPVESFMRKKVTISLFWETAISAQLKEVYTIWDGHE